MPRHALIAFATTLLSACGRATPPAGPAPAADAPGESGWRRVADPVVDRA